MEGEFIVGGVVSEEAAASCVWGGAKEPPSAASETGSYEVRILNQNGPVEMTVVPSVGTVVSLFARAANPQKRRCRR